MSGASIPPNLDKNWAQYWIFKMSYNSWILLNFKQQGTKFSIYDLHKNP